jgi:hypothetical protein
MSSRFTNMYGRLLVCVSVVGCSGASWQRVTIDPSYQPPKEMTITIIARSSLKDASDALGSALVDDLASHGIKATCIPETAGAPDANVTIEKFDPGSRALRWAIGFGSGEGQVIVNIESASIDGTARGWVRGGLFGGSDQNSAAAAGHFIAETIASGKPEPDPRGSSRFAH